MVEILAFSQAGDDCTCIECGGFVDHDTARIMTDAGPVCMTCEQKLWLTDCIITPFAPDEYPEDVGGRPTSWLGEVWQWLICKLCGM